MADTPSSRLSPLGPGPCPNSRDCDGSPARLDSAGLSRHRRRSGASATWPTTAPATTTAAAATTTWPARAWEATANYSRGREVRGKQERRISAAGRAPTRAAAQVLAGRARTEKEPQSPPRFSSRSTTSGMGQHPPTPLKQTPTTAWAGSGWSWWWW